MEAGSLQRGCFPPSLQSQDSARRAVTSAGLATRAPAAASAPAATSAPTASASGVSATGTWTRLGRRGSASRRAESASAASTTPQGCTARSAGKATPGRGTAGTAARKVRARSAAEAQRPLVARRGLDRRMRKPGGGLRKKRVGGKSDGGCGKSGVNQGALLWPMVSAGAGAGAGVCSGLRTLSASGASSFLVSGCNKPRSQPKGGNHEWGERKGSASSWRHKN